MRPITSLITALGASLFLAHTSFAASFDCAKAGTPMEKQICSDPFVSELDEHLGRYYRVAQQRLGRASECLRRDQRRWLREARNTCTTVECLKQAYGLRLRELEGFQPGASTVESIELPAGPTLMWIFAPAEDAQAVPSGSSKPFAIEGIYIDESLHGPSVRTDDGEVYVIVPSMLFEGDPHGVLERLMSSRARVVVRGLLMDVAPDPRDYEDPAQTPKGHLDNRECIYLHTNG